MSGDSTKKVDRTHHRESMTLAQWKAQKASLPKSCTHCGGALRMPYATNASQGQAPSQPDLSAELEQARAAAQHDHWRADYAEQQIQQIAQQTQNEKHLRDLKELCGAVKGDLPVSDELVDLWLGSEAQRHPELLQAYINRDSNAAGYQQLKAYAAREFFKFVRTIPDPEASETKAIVSHAVRGASTSSPPEDPAPNFGAMSDNELREYTRKNFNFV